MVELSDEPLAGPQEVRLESACSLYARGRIGKIAASRLAGVDFFAFQRALAERNIPLYTEKMLAEDLATLQHIPKSSPKPVNNNLGVSDALAVTHFSARPPKFLALTAENLRNILSIKHFPRPAFYSAVAPPRLAAAL